MSKVETMDELKFKQSLRDKRRVDLIAMIMDLRRQLLKCRKERDGEHEDELHL